MEPVRSRRALVIGSAGFIGHHLVSELVAGGYEVTSADLKPDFDQPNAVAVDIGSDTSVKHLADACPKLDLVVHLAGLIRGSQEQLAEINVAGFARVQKFCRAEKCVSLGSAAEYGVPRCGLVSEDHPCNPISAYGLTKWSATQQRSQWIIIRPSSVLGAGMAGTNLVGHILSALRRGERQIAISSNTVVRDYLSARNCATGIRLAAERGTAGQIYNLGTGIPTSIASLQETIQTVSGIQFELVENPKPDEIEHFVLDPGKAKRELGFEPRDTLEEMIGSAWKGFAG